MTSPSRIAAIDLGSNSFRLEIGWVDQGRLRRSEYLKESVRLGNGLDRDRNLTEEAMLRGWACLARFGERLAGFNRQQIRAVATQTLREARNRDAFLGPARKILGFPIDVISGVEEARLIYQGVSRFLPQSDERRFVVDIGGRSTELVIGQGFAPEALASFRVGSVSWSMKFFPGGVFTRQGFATASIAAQAVLDEALNTYGRAHWDVAFGSSGTVGAVADILAAEGFAAGVVRRDGLRWLCDRMLRAQSADRLKLNGLKDDRKAVLGGGISVLMAVFDLLDIEEMHVAQGALRHGVLHELAAGDRELGDLRTLSIQGLAQRYGVDMEQADRVARVAVSLLDRLQTPTRDEGAPPRERTQRKLHWAALLHEIGAQISHSDYHKHSAYILDHADISGFAQHELHHLSQLVLGHRGKVHKLDVDLADSRFALQLMVLRLAVILCHARRQPRDQPLTLSWDGATGVVLRHPAEWAVQYPQSAHLLEAETLAWKKTPWTLSVLPLEAH